MKYSLPFLRTPAGSTQLVTVATRVHVHARTHWLGGRKLLCAGEGCPACVVDEPRHQVYVVVFSAQAGKHYLLEITERSWFAIKFLTTKGATNHLLPGDTLALHRKRKTSPLRVEVVDRKPDQGTHPELTALRAVSAVYGLSLPAAHEEPASFFARENLRIKWRLTTALKELEGGPLLA